MNLASRIRGCIGSKQNPPLTYLHITICIDLASLLKEQGPNRADHSAAPANQTKQPEYLTITPNKMFDF